VNTLNINKEKVTHYVYISLLFVVGLLILLILIGSIAGLFHIGKPQPLIGTRSAPQVHQTLIQTDDIRIFTGMGRLRIPLVNSSTLILSIAFPFSADDTAFTEEIAAKVNDFRTIANEYFSALPEPELIRINEEAAKQEILRRFNENLRLGRIEVLYFNDMMVIESY